jgi:hypothetical protein
LTIIQTISTSVQGLGLFLIRDKLDPLVIKFELVRLVLLVGVKSVLPLDLIGVVNIGIVVLG